MSESPRSDPSHVGHLPAELSLRASETDLLSGPVPDRRLPVYRGDPVLEKTHPAEFRIGMRDLEVIEERFECGIRPGETDLCLPERHEEFFCRRIPELLLSCPAEAVLGRAHSPGTVGYPGKTHSPYLLFVKEDDLVVPFVGVDDHHHDAMRSWI